MKKIVFITFVSLILSCSDNHLEKKGFAVSQIENIDSDDSKINGINPDSMKFETRPRNVLLTSYPEHRLTPIYKVNYTKKEKKPFAGSNSFHGNYWSYGTSEGNEWNRNYMPGFEAVYGYNFVNVSHFNNKLNAENLFFEKPVLIKTLYYPAFSNDTLEFEPIKRNFYMVSAYDDDSNGDGYINVKDLRRLYYFDIEGKNQRALIPKTYSVLSSEYDPKNDFMYIFCKLDQNKNGQMDYGEETHIFWIDLKDPTKVGIQYRN